jgi:hypothetical protein
VGHEIWHVVVLATTLFGVAGALLLGLATLVFDSPPRGLLRVRPLLVALVAIAAVVFAVEWLVVH